MIRFLKERTTGIVIIICIILLVLTILTAVQGYDMTAAEGMVGQLLNPVKSVVYRIVADVDGYFAGIDERRDIAENYARLKERVAELEGELIAVRELERENARLEQLLDFAGRMNMFEVSGGRVIGKDPGNWFNIFTIDIGSADGVETNMAVVNNRGLIGRVIDVGPGWAKVRAMVDGQSAASAIVERTRDNGLVRGNNRLGFEDGLFRMIYLPLDADIVPGDKVMTSGLDGVFPRGILIGDVKEVLRQQRDLFVVAIIQPAADFQRLEKVLVIKSVRGAADS